MQLLVKLLTNSLYGENIRKDIEESFSCESEYWMMSEYDERVKDYWKISHSNYGFYTNDVYYTDTDSLNIENKHWEKLNKVGLIGKKLLQGKND